MINDTDKKSFKYFLHSQLSTEPSRRNQGKVAVAEMGKKIPVAVSLIDNTMQVLIEPSKEEILKQHIERKDYENTDGQHKCEALWEQFTLDDKKKMFVETFTDCLRITEQEDSRLNKSSHNNINIKLRELSNTEIHQSFNPLINFLKFIFNPHFYAEELCAHAISVISNYLQTPFLENSFTISFMDTQWTTDIVLVDVYFILGSVLEDIVLLPNPQNLVQKLLDTASCICSHTEIAAGAYLGAIDMLYPVWSYSSCWPQYERDFQVSVMKRLVDGFCRILVEQSTNEFFMNSSYKLVETISHLVQMTPEPEVFNSICEAVAKSLEESTKDIIPSDNYWSCMENIVSNMPGGHADAGTMNRWAHLIVKFCAATDKQMVTSITAQRSHFPIFLQEQREILFTEAKKLASNPQTLGQALHVLQWFFRTTTLECYTFDHRTPAIVDIILPVLQATLPAPGESEEHFIYLQKLAIRCIFAILSDSTDDTDMLQHWWPSEDIETKMTHLNDIYKLLGSKLDNKALVLEVLANWKCDWSDDGGPWDDTVLCELANKSLNAFKTIAHAAGTLKVPKQSSWEDIHSYCMNRLSELDPETFKPLAVRHAEELAKTIIELNTWTLPITTTMLSLKELAVISSFRKEEHVNTIMKTMPDLHPQTREVYLRLEKVRNRLTLVLLHCLYNIVQEYEKYGFMDNLSNSFLETMGLLLVATKSQASYVLLILGELVKIVKPEDMVEVLLISKDDIEAQMDEDPETVINCLFEPLLAKWNPCFEDFDMIQMTFQPLQKPNTEKEPIYKFIPSLLQVWKDNIHRFQSWWVDGIPNIIENCWPSTTEQQREDITNYFRLFPLLFEGQPKAFKEEVMFLEETSKETTQELTLQVDQIDTLYSILHENDLKTVVESCVRILGPQNLTQQDNKKRKREDEDPNEKSKKVTQ